jgi:hypothetical protein
VASLLPALLLPGTSRAVAPDFVYETTLPGYYLGRGLDMVVDDAGNAFVTASYYEDQHTLDILIFKLDPEGTPLWIVPVGEDNSVHDYATGIVLDTAGDVWVTGWTSSESFPTTPDALDDTLTGFTDAFVLKLDSEDGTILYGTYLGGDYVDRGRDICLNDAGEIYLVGYTGSTDFPTTADAYQSDPSAPLYIFQDAFITKLSADGQTILYSTYFGGFEDDWGENIALEADGDIVISGTTNADDFPLVNPINPSPDKIFISRFSADGTELLFSTYFGGLSIDYLHDMELDADDFVYITGSTRSVSFPTTAGSFQENFVGEINGCEEGFPGHPVNCYDGFLVKLATDGTGVQYGTYLGGSINDEGSDVVVDAAGSAHVVGYTGSPDFLGTGNNFASIFVAGLDAAGSDLEFAVTKQSPSAGSGHGIALDHLNNTYFTGALNVPYDIYVAKLNSLAPGPVSVIDAEGGPAVLSLGPNVPNPFRGATRVTYSISAGEAARTRLAVYNASGRLVRTLVDGVVAAGAHSASWDGTNRAGTPVPAGVYFYRLEARGTSKTGRMVLVR